MRANFDPKPCAGERKAASAGTMGINGKNNGNNEKCRGAPTSGVNAERRAMGRRANGRQVNWVCLEDSWMSV
jgi:hypothetical protein